MTVKRFLALTVAGALIAAGAAPWLGSSDDALSIPAGTLAFSGSEEGVVVVAAADGPGLPADLDSRAAVRPELLTGWPADRVLAARAALDPAGQQRGGPFAGDDPLAGEVALA